MNEEIDENEFYQQDFTTASEWEIFMARIEEVINQWKSESLHFDKSDPFWHTKKENIIFIDTNFELILYKKKALNLEKNNLKLSLEPTNHVINSWYDFNVNEGPVTLPDQCLSKWYGLEQFIVLKPLEKMEITSESKIKVLLSSINIAVGNTNCHVPLFIQIREHWQKLYLGVCEKDNIRTNFEMSHLRKGPQYCYYLSGVLDLFKTKVMSPCTIENIIISLKSSYALTNFGPLVWNLKQNSNSDLIDIENLFELPFGVTVEPIQSIILNAIWHHLSEYSVVDTENHTDFLPLKAQNWQCSVNMTYEPLCLLGESLNEIYLIFNNDATVYDLLDIVSAPPTSHHPLDRLTEPVVPTMSTLLNGAARNSISEIKKSNRPIQDHILVPVLYFLFPDAVEDSQFSYGRENKEEVKDKDKLIYNTENKFKGFKTCPEDSLVWRLSIILTHCLQSLGGVKAFCHIWYEFVQEMRYRWEKSLPIPGVTPGVPDLRTCLLNQKLQMLNCCLERKISRENHLYASAENSEDSEDEFFDTTDAKEERKYSLWNQPVGRLSKFGELKLLKTGDPLYIPFTQDPVLKTEDQLEEDTDLLLQLGSDQEASELRARIMAASLLSDMESFKAANPGSVLEDFIRWYSPRDWIESEELDKYDQPKGQLSPRMLIGNNIWRETWQNARPVPANRQKRLFDDTREAEKVLQYLEFRTIGQIAELLIPGLSHAAICQIVQVAEYDISFFMPEIQNQIDNLLKYGERLSRDSKFYPKRFETFIQEVTAVELMMSQINSLKFKFGNNETNNEAIGKLVLKQDIELVNKENSDIGKRISSMFNESQRSLRSPGENSKVNDNEMYFPPAHEREFVIRANCVRPSFSSAKSPQYLRVILGQKEFRLVGAFSEDMTFF